MSGETTREIKMRAKYTGWDIVILLGGTNDLGDYEPAEIFSNLQEMYSNFEKETTTVVAVTVPGIRMVCHCNLAICELI